MSDDPQQRRGFGDPIPPMYCPAAETARGSHEWRPRGEDFYCSRCVARLEAEHAEEWQQRAGEQQIVEPPTDSNIDSAELAAEALPLTPLERQLLLRLASEPAAVISYPELAEFIWGLDSADQADRAALRQLVARLRNKLTCLRAEVSTVASVGYRFGFVCADGLGDD